jgi:hypothetical protein
MQYLVKEFPPGLSGAARLRIADDRLSPLSKDGIWFWINQASSRNRKIAFFAMLYNEDDADPYSDILIVDHSESPPILNLYHPDEAPTIDSCVESKFVFHLKCVLDLS